MLPHFYPTAESARSAPSVNLFPPPRPVTTLAESPQSRNLFQISGLPPGRMARYGIAVQSVLSHLQDVSVLIHWQRAADRPPPESAGGNTPVSERGPHSPGARTLSSADGRTGWNAPLPTNVRSGCWGFGTPRERGRRQLPHLLLHRVFAGVLVFHAFVKKTQRTPPLEIALAGKRLKEILDA